MSAAPLTLGTAGHIDHGKTALIRALTGVDTDRLPQEHARGISIELGYASLALPSGRRLSVVDVPGHKGFVRTMVAGATGIDLYLMTVAADDGVMPQTREHAEVLRALDVPTGVVAVTKSDLTDPKAAMSEASDLFPRAEVVPVSARRGDGLDALRAALDRAAQSVPSRADAGGPARLHIDRVFTIRGAGTVVTGTLWSGSIAQGDVLELLPGHRRARVRGVQVHDEPRDVAAAGQRVAVNLTGIRVADLARGDVLGSSDSGLEPTYLIDAQLAFGAEEPEHGDRVQIHHGTREAPGRLTWLGGRFWQLRLEQPLLAVAGDRLVVRQIAPPDTLGGGVVLDARPRKHGPSRDLTAALTRRAAGQADTEPPSASPPAQSDDAGAPEPEPLSQSALELERRLRDAGAEPPPDSELDAADLAALRDAGRAVRVSKGLHYHPGALAAIRARVIALALAHGGQITLAQLRDELGTSRKFAQALLEHFDAERVTIRRGDDHFLRRSAARPSSG
jgi:selenocysteine-specific elongation factor